MDTPICDFVEEYISDDTVRLHMPGHKGKELLGVERFDITEFDGADDLYKADGIIKRSEENAGVLFGCNTFYSCEGSSLCIKAMLYLVRVLRGSDANNGRSVILAARNAHKAFINAVALLDFDVKWIHTESASIYYSCCVTAQDVERALVEARVKPSAVYVTSPDYLGNIIDIKAISEVCKRYGVLLLVDNAHGAYLKFLSESKHPIDLGADMCCDSAHKTLPVLTGGAYLHVSGVTDGIPVMRVKDALSIFGSSSPSYLILQSLDRANKYLESYAQELSGFISKVVSLKEKLVLQGYTLYGDEPLKITLSIKQYGYSGDRFAEILLDNGVMCEFHDPDFVVLMVTPQNSDDELGVLEKILMGIPKKAPVNSFPPEIKPTQQVMSVRQAILSDAEILPTDKCSGRILATASIGCPPAVPIVMCGERINDSATEFFKYYGITDCTVVKER